MLILIDDYSKPEDPIHPEIEVLPLEYSSAEEIAETLEELLVHEALCRLVERVRVPVPFRIVRRIAKGHAPTEP